MKDTMQTSLRMPLRTFTVLFLVAVLFSACHRRQGVVISGHLTAAPRQMVYLDRLDVDRGIPVDSMKTGRDGRFRFAVALDEPTYFLLKLSSSNFITLLAEPGEHIRVEADSLFLPAAYRVSGSEGSQLVKELDDHLRVTVRRADSIARIYRRRMNEPGFDTLRPRLDSLYNAVVKAQRRYTIGFILEHLHSPAAVKALYQKIDPNTYVLYDIKDLQYMKIVADTLQKVYPDAKITKALVQDLQKEMARYNELRLQSLMKKAEVVDLDLALPDSTGDTITLSSLWKQGHYVLLTFWASWSQQSVADNLALLKLYRRYHPRGFEVYAVSLDTDRRAWQRQVRFDELPWVNVWDSTGRAAQRYNVQLPPRNFLFSPEGQVVARDIHGRSLQIKLSQLYD